MSSQTPAGWARYFTSNGFSDCVAIIGQNPGLFQHWSPAVASITIRNLDDDIKQRLRVRAAD